MRPLEGEDGGPDRTVRVRAKGETAPMSDVRQETSGTAGPAAEVASEMVVSQSEGPALDRWAQLQKDRQISQSSLDTLHQQRVRAVDGLQKIEDRKSTRLNSSHLVISYAVFCLKKKTINMYTIGISNFYLQ